MPCARRALKAGGLFAPISREGALVLNNLLLLRRRATVFLGTLYPLFLDAVGGPKLSVGLPFFNRTFVPLMVPVLIAVAVGPLLAWKRGDLAGALQRLWLALAGAVVVVLVGLYATGGGPVLAVLGLGLAAWALLAARGRMGGAHPAAARAGSPRAGGARAQPAAGRLRHDAGAYRPCRHRRRHRRLRLAAGAHQVVRAGRRSRHRRLHLASRRRRPGRRGPTSPPTAPASR